MQLIPSTLATPSPIPTLDLELLAQRINKLAEIATLEHLDDLLHGQARELLALRSDIESALNPTKNPRTL